MTHLVSVVRRAAVQVFSAVAGAALLAIVGQGSAVAADLPVTAMPYEPAPAYRPAPPRYYPQARVQVWSRTGPHLVPYVGVPYNGYAYRPGYTYIEVPAYRAYSPRHRRRR